MKRSGIRLSTLILAVVLALLIISTSVLTALYTVSYRDTLSDTSAITSRQTTSQLSGLIHNYFSDVSQLEELLEETLQSDTESREELFSALLKIRPDVVAISTYSADGELMDCYSASAEPRKVISLNLSFDAELAAHNPEGYISAPHVISFLEGSYPWAVTFLYPVDTSAGERWLAMDISFTTLSEYIDGAGIGQHGYCFLMDGEGNIVYHPQQQLIYFSLKEENTSPLVGISDSSVKLGDLLYTVVSVEGSSWRVVGVNYLEESISAETRSLQRSLIPIGALILISAAALSLHVAGTLARPLQELGDAMGRFEKNADGFTFSPVSGFREANQLSDSFDHMVRRIQQLMARVRAEETSLRKTELKALQAQINPHFLYNTLDSITWMCEDGKVPEAIRMTNALARLFRVSISKGHELIPVSSELKHAESYLEIQSERYAGQFTYRFEVDESCKDLFCNKITLQPFIENAINHGLNGLVEEGQITIGVHTEDNCLIMTVEDNGIGMPPEALEAVMNRSDDDAGIGIKNVDDRLKIYFGNTYGVTLFSEPEAGTRVIIRMPILTREQVREYENR